MSALWPERIAIGFAPDRLTAVRWRGFRRNVVASEDITLPDAATGGVDAPLAALNALLTQPAWKRGRIDIVLSNHYARYALLVLTPGMKPAAIDTLARIVFDKTYGELSRQWTLRVSPTPSAGTALASGIPMHLLDGVRAACAKRLRSIQPLLMPVFNQARDDIGASRVRMTMAEPGRVTMLRIDNARWIAVSSRTAAMGDSSALSKVLADEEAMQPTEGDALWLCDLDPPIGSRTGVRTLRPRATPAASTAQLAHWAIQ